MFCFFFFFHEPATTETYTYSHTLPTRRSSELQADRLLFDLHHAPAGRRHRDRHPRRGRRASRSARLAETWRHGRDRGLGYRHPAESRGQGILTRAGFRSAPPGGRRAGCEALAASLISRPEIEIGRAHV